MIALINHPGIKIMKGLQYQTPAPPIGLAYLGAFLKQHGHSYTAVDACGEALSQIRADPNNPDILIQGLTHQQVLQHIPAETQILGFSCLFSHCWPLTLELATSLKPFFPDALFIAGGEHPTALPEQVLSSNTFDLVVLGEGEETFLELVESVQKGESWKEIAGIAYRNPNGNLHRTASRKRARDIDQFPHPDWDSWSIEEYIQHQQTSGLQQGRSIPILGTRGCPYVCAFCSNETMWGKKFVMRDPKKLVAEMTLMKERYQVNSFIFMDSTFVIHRRRVLEFAQELIRQNLNITYQLPVGTRCEAVDLKLARALEKSGLRNFAFAPESGSEEILKVVRKEMNLEHLFSAIRAVRQTNITLACFVVIGFPEDTPETLQKTLRLVRQLAWLGVDDITVSQFVPYPGSAYFRQLQKQGVFSEDWSELDQVISFYSEMERSYCGEVSAKALHRWMLWMFANFYIISFLTRPQSLFTSLWNYATKGIEQTRYMRFLHEFLFNRRRWKQRHG